MKLIASFTLAHPWHSLVLMLLLLTAGLADGVGLSAMLPMLDLAFNAGAEASIPSANQRSGLSATFSDAVTGLGLTPSIGVLLSFIVVGIGLKSLFVFIAEREIGYLAADVATEMRVRLLRALIRSRWSYYVDQSVGKLANAMATEAWRASNAYVYAVRLLVGLVETIVYFGLALLVSWKATVICILAGFVVWGISHRFVRISRFAGTGQTRWYRSLLGLLTNLLSSIKTFKAMGREQAAEALVLRETLELKKELRREVLGNSALDAAQEPMYTLVIVVGIYIALVHLSVDMATVTFLTLVLARLLKRGSKVQKQFQLMAASESAYWAIEAMIDEAQQQGEPMGGSKKPQLEQSISLCDVSLRYGDKTVLDHVSIDIPAHQMTCLIGESGAGKSTIADLIAGLIVPDQGSLRIDNVPIGDLDLLAWRHSIGYVPQENLLINDSIFFNVTLGDENLSAADVERALHAAGAHEFTSAMPDGIYTMVGERGARLSGGQRQRIMIARALVHDPKLLILDEATSALDDANEAAICRTLAKLKGRVTILTISHQDTLRDAADHVFHIMRGDATLRPADHSVP